MYMKRVALIVAVCLGVFILFTQRKPFITDVQKETFFAEIADAVNEGVGQHINRLDASIARQIEEDTDLDALHKSLDTMLQPENAVIFIDPSDLEAVRKNLHAALFSDTALTEQEQKEALKEALVDALIDKFFNRPDQEVLDSYHKMLKKHKKALTIIDRTI